ncbi:MAG TPA: metallophosphoesterase [Saprospiraceae bacterium]|nr:metallophosphoesterase [Saprospiraceae bacterium]
MKSKKSLSKKRSSPIFIIGDPHFRAKNYLEGEELTIKCVDTATSLNPEIIIILGDILDTHEVARNTPFKQAIKFIELLSDIAPVYVLIGNHDLVNQSQYLTDNHFFVPLKKWPNVTIVDEPIKITIKDKNFVLCPYVPPGRFQEALDVLVDEEFDWRFDANCIFAHQEIRGVVYGGKESTKGDIWEDEYPPLICGHIHTPCQVGNNVFYPGSSVQVAIDEAPDKRVWSLTFNDEWSGADALKIEKIDLGLKGKKEVEIAIEDIEEFDFDLTEKYYIKLKIRGTSEQFKLFRKSKLHAELIRKSVKIGFDPIKTDILPLCNEGATKGKTFEQIVKKLVKKRSENVKKAYEDMNTTEVEFVEN